MRKIKIDVLNNKITLGNNNEPNNSMLIHVVELDSFTTELELDFTGLNVDEYIKAVDFETSDGIKTQYRIGNGVIATMPLDSFLTKGGLLKIQPFALNEETGRRLGGFIYEVNVIHSINAFDQGNPEEFPDFGKLLQDQIDEINIEVVDINGRLDLKADKSYVDDTIDYINNLLSGKVNNSRLDNFSNTGKAVEQVISEIEVGDADLSNYYTKPQTDALLNPKADKSTTYTKVEVDTLIDGVEVDLTNYYDKGEINGLLNDKVSETNFNQLSSEVSLLGVGMDGKADKNAVYTKTEVNSLIDDVYTDINGVSQELNDFKAEVADYVVETGENANGSWEKWNSGKLVQWQRISVPSQASLPWGSLHYLKIPNWTYPLPFISPPLVSGSNETLFGFFGQSKATSTILDTPMWIMAGTFTSAVVMNLKAEGRWK